MLNIFIFSPFCLANSTVDSFWINFLGEKSMIERDRFNMVTFFRVKSHVTWDPEARKLHLGSARIPTSSSLMPMEMAY